VTRFEPLEGYVLVRQLAGDESVGGIVIPETLRDKSPQVVVVAVGPGRVLSDGTRQPVTLQPGDRALVGGAMGGHANAVKLDGQEYLVMLVSALIGVFREES